MSGRFLFRVFKPFFTLTSYLLYLLPRFLVEWLWPITGLFPGFAGASLRYILLKRLCGSVGDNVYVASNVVFKNSSRIFIGSNVSFHEFCYLDGFGGVTIGDDVSIAHGTSIVSFEHTWADISKPIKYNNLLGRQISISNDVWIGCGVRILSGVDIGHRSVVAAGSVVKKSVPNNTIVAGVPAKPIKNI